MRCPVCEGSSTGRIGTNEYYCWDCCIEFQDRGAGRFDCFVLDSEGNRVRVGAVTPAPPGAGALEG